MKKIKVAILDDYQSVTHHFANWEKLSDKIELKIFNEYIGDVSNLSEKLSDYDVLCLMRERTPLPRSLINKLPNLKLVITSGMWNASVDSDTLKKKNIIFQNSLAQHTLTIHHYNYLLKQEFLLL